MNRWTNVHPPGSRAEWEQRVAPLWGRYAPILRLQRFLALTSPVMPEETRRAAFAEYRDLTDALLRKRAAEVAERARLAEPVRPAIPYPLGTAWTVDP